MQTPARALPARIAVAVLLVAGAAVSFLNSARDRTRYGGSGGGRRLREDFLDDLT